MTRLQDYQVPWPVGSIVQHRTQMWKSQIREVVYVDSYPMYNLVYFGRYDPEDLILVGVDAWIIYEKMRTDDP